MRMPEEDGKEMLYFMMKSFQVVYFSLKEYRHFEYYCRVDNYFSILTKLFVVGIV